VGIYLVKNGLVYFSTVRALTKTEYKEGFLDEYQKSLEYCSKYDCANSQSANPVFICGEFENTQEVLQVINNANDLSKNAKLANVWINVFEVSKYLPDIPFERSLSFAGSIGVALSDIT
jgi:hypothetical protein